MLEHGGAPWRLDRLREFWAFVAERHNVFYRRVVLKESPPWTEDPIIQTVAFTNIYRELDRTTRVLLRSFPEWEESKEDLLFNVIKFRFFTWSPTYWALGGYRPAAEWPWVLSKHASRLLVSRQKAGHQVFTGAFMVTSLGAKPGLGGKVQLVVKRISWVKRHLPRLASSVFEARSMPDAHLALCEVPGFGGFMAYEVLIDLTYTNLVPFNRNSWVFVGPGAVKGLRILLDEDDVVNVLIRDDPQLLVADLRDSQCEGFRDAQVTMRGPALTLENIEQALCEYQKYVRAKETKRVKRKFDHVAVNTDYSLWEDIPEEFTNPLLWVR